MLNPTASIDRYRARAPARRAVTAGHLSGFGGELVSRLQAGTHLILHGPRGSGKSTLLARIRDRYDAGSVPCAVAPETSGLADVVDAFSSAYRDLDLRGLNRRAIATRLRLTAERTPGVLLLDHVRELTTAMIGFLRLLRGGVIGALLVVDIDSQFERERLLSWRRHALCARMPLMPNRALYRLLSRACAQQLLPAIEPAAAGQMVHCARGRAGWLTECVRRLHDQEYWRDGHLHLAALCSDTEMALRDKRGPRMRLTS